MSTSLSKPKLTVGGLAIGPNDLDADPGNFLIADNVVHRRAGMLEPLPGEHYYMDTGSGQYSRVFSDWEPNTILKLRKQTADSFAQLIDPATDVVNTSANFQPGETQCVFTDGRHILSGAEHVVVVDNNDGVTSTPRRAGMPQVSGVQMLGGATDTTGTSTQTTVAAGKVVAYTAIVRRRLAVSRYIQSAACSKVTTPIEAFPANYTLTVRFETTATSSDDLYSVGDEILLFRTVAAGSVAEINDTFYLAAIHKLTSADLAAKTATIQDNTLEANLGEELYTNPGQQGALKANLVPPRSSGVETYVNTTFYINKQAAPTLTMTVVGAFGTLPTAIDDATKQKRQNGIGIRAFSGNTTNLSADITNVSAADRIGLSIGQAVFGGDLTGARYITAFSGAGPYTVTVDRVFTSTGGPVSFTSEDVMQVTASKDGVTTTSEKLLIGQLQEAQDELLGMQSLAAVAMPGFVVNSGSFASIVDGSVYDDFVQLNFSVTVPDLWDSFDLKLTSPNNWIESDTGAVANYKTVSSVQETRRNVVWYSKTNLPEDVAPVQFFTVGNGVVYRLLNVQSVMLAFCSDGLYKVFGQGDTWSILPVDTSAKLVHPDCAYASGALGFAWLEQGFCAVSETGVEDIGKDAIGPTLKSYALALSMIVGGPRGLWGPSLVIDKHNHEVWLNIVYMATGQAPLKYETFIFNTDTGKFTTAANTYTALSYYSSILNLIRAKNDFSGTGLYRPNLPGSSLIDDYLPATVVYQPLVSNAGLVKQWVDENLFLDAVPAAGSGTYRVEALFGGETSSSTNVFDVPATAPSRLFALHSLVPRRVARDVKLTLGFATSITPDSSHPSGGYYFQFKGASVRVRVASDIVKR